MPAWVLRVIAVLVAGLSMLGSTTYALAHPKNPNAPLQPPVASKEQTPDPTPEETVAPAPFRTLAPTPPPTPSPSPTATPRATATVAGTQARASGTVAPTRPPTPSPTLRPTPVPQITRAAGVRATALPKVTYTHSS